MDDSMNPVIDVTPEPSEPARTTRALDPRVKHAILVDVAMAVAGAAVGAVIFYLLTRDFDKPSEYLVFACLGAGFPFGWRALRLWRPFSRIFIAHGSNIVAVMLVWLIPVFLFILKAWFALVIGLPVLFFHVIRHVWRVVASR